MTATSWLVLGALVFASWCIYSKGKKPRTLPGHSHAGNRAHVARHEGGHYVAARAVGGRVRSARLSGGSHPNGMVQATVPNAKASITFLLAGEAAAPGAGCSADMAAVRKTLREFPSSERAAVRRECQREANRIVAARAGEIQRVAKKLDANGRI